MSSQGLYSATDCPICYHPPLPPSPHRSNPGLSQLSPRAVTLTMGKIQVVCSDIATAAPARRPGGQEHPASLRGTGKHNMKPVSAPLPSKRARAGRNPQPQLCPEEGLSTVRTYWREGWNPASTEMGVLWPPGDHRGRTMGRQSPGLQDRQCSQPELPTCLCLTLMDRETP